MTNIVIQILKTTTKELELIFSIFHRLFALSLSSFI
jgi:hypothetical protein